MYIVKGSVSVCLNELCITKRNTQRHHWKTMKMVIDFSNLYGATTGRRHRFKETIFYQLDTQHLQWLNSVMTKRDIPSNSEIQAY